MLIDLLKYRFKFTGGKHPRGTGRSEPTIKAKTDINTDNAHFKNDVIDLIDLCISIYFTCFSDKVCTKENEIIKYSYQVGGRHLRVSF